MLLLRLMLGYTRCQPRTLDAISSAASFRAFAVIDLTRVWAGPLVARILADYGAHVVKVADPRIAIDRTRGVDNKHNRNKDSLALRLDLQEGRDAFLDLASVSDIVIESFRPHVMRNFRLDYESLRQVAP